MNIDTEIKTLSPVEKVLYKYEVEFYKEYHPEYTSEQLHEAGMKKVISVRKLGEEASKPQKYVDLSTGKTFWATENELESKHS